MAANQKDYEDSNWLLKKLLTAVSYGLALHYSEIQKAWQLCGSNSLCKAEKLVMYFTAIFGISSPSVLLSQVANKYANKVWENANGIPLIDKDAYWSQAIMNVGVYTVVEYQMSFWWDWVRYATECLKVGACENDDILIWINNMKAGHCNKTEIEFVHVELDCVEGDCTEVQDYDVISKVKDDSDWCVVFFNELPLLLSAILIWASYLISVSLITDEKTLVKLVGADRTGGESSKVEKAGDKRGNDPKGEKSTDNKNEKQGDKEGSRNDNGKRKNGNGDDDSNDKRDKGGGKEESADDKGKDGDNAPTSDGEANGSDSPAKDNQDGESGTGNDRKCGETKGNSKENKGKPSGNIESRADKQQVVIFCADCNKAKKVCIPKPLLIFCEKCGNNDPGPKPTTDTQPPMNDEPEKKEVGEEDEKPNSPPPCFKVAKLSENVMYIGSENNQMVRGESENQILKDEDVDYNTLYAEYYDIAKQHEGKLSRSKCIICVHAQESGVTSAAAIEEWEDNEISKM